MKNIDAYYKFANDDVIYLVCKKCSNSSKLDIKYRHSLEEREELPDGKKLRYELINLFCVCEICSAFSIIEVVHEVESLRVIYPIERRFINISLPKVVKISYQEAIRCEQAHIPFATVVMVGRTIEAVIKEFEQDEKTIFQGLEKLKNNGIISQDIFQWANELRVLRNIGAHAVDEKIDVIDAEEAMDFLQSILEIIYHLRPKFIQMKKRREKIRVQQK